MLIMGAMAEFLAIVIDILPGGRGFKGTSHIMSSFRVFLFKFTSLVYSESNTVYALHPRFELISKKKTFSLQLISHLVKTSCRL